MPYRVNSDLPPRVRSHLPEHAQDIYREAFNHAYAAHAGDREREKRAHSSAHSSNRTTSGSRANWMAHVCSTKAALSRQLTRRAVEAVERKGVHATAQQLMHHRDGMSIAPLAFSHGV